METSLLRDTHGILLLGMPRVHGKTWMWVSFPFPASSGKVWGIP